MKTLYIILCFLFVTTVFAQPVVDWQKSIGGSNADIAHRVLPTADGGFVVVGSTSSADGDIGSTLGQSDGWLVKFSENGAIEWEKTYGGNLNDSLFSIVETYDGSYVMVGCSESQSLVGTSPKGMMDVWVVKISNDGSLQWQRTFGGSNNDIGKSIQITPDSGFVIGATSFSTTGDITSNNGGADVWILKLSSTGTIEWQKNYGGSNNEYIGEIAIRANGDFIFVATTESNNGDVTGYRGAKDYWVVTIFSNGQIQWQKAIGGSGNDMPNAVMQTTNGDYIVTGTSNSSNGDVQSQKGGYDVWTVMFNTGGDIVWKRNYGGSGDETGVAIRSTLTSGYVIVGNSNSTNGDLTKNNGNTDAWIFQIAQNSELQWQQSYGGSGADGFQAFTIVKDKGLCAVGFSGTATADVTENKGASDSWIVKFAGVPKAGFTTSTDTICNDGFIELTVEANVTPEETIWLLKGAKDSIMIGNSVVTEYPDTGVFPITIITKSSAGNDTLTVQNRIVVLPKPKPGIFGLVEFCKNDRFDIYLPINEHNSKKYEWRIHHPGGTVVNVTSTSAWVQWGEEGGTITLIETIRATGCSDSITKTIKILPIPESEFTAEFDTICPNTILNYVRTSNSENTVYSWSISQVNPLIPGREIININSESLTVNWTTSGFFSVSLIGTDSVTKCVTTNQKKLYVYYDPSPFISPITDTICGSNRATYKIANYNLTDQFEWSVTNGQIVHQSADTAIIQWNAGSDGIITVTQKSPEIPCLGSSSITQPLSTNPNKPTVVRIGNLLTASMANSYQWYLNQNAVPGATNQTFNINEEGLYSVYATYENGTCGAFSDIVSTITSVAETTEPNYSIQPNPTSGIFRFSSYFDQNTILSIDVISSMGIPLQSYSNIEAKGTFQKELNCTSFPTGVYFLRIQSNQTTRYIPFVKQ